MPTPLQACPSSVRFQPETAILALGARFYEPVSAAPFETLTLRFRNDRAAATVGLESLGDDAWIRHFGAFEALPGSLPTPLALAYHGHQFRVYNPDIGDGRGFLFAQLRDGKGRLLDLGTKGSGQTPFSRQGDGRLTLKGGVREVLATEMLEALGVETSRSFSLIETNERLWRGDEPSPTRAAVLVRLSHGHIRIGTFQRLAALGDDQAMHTLVDYTLANLLDRPGGDEAALLAEVTRRTARLAASYMAAGFVHGVLNSDNINVTGESFDYGPWRFTPFFDPGFTAAYFDHQGLYSFARQAEAIHWDLGQLAVSLRLIADSAPLIAALQDYAPQYRAALVERMLWRLGIKPAGEDADIALVAAIEQALLARTVTIDDFFFDWRGGRLRDGCPNDRYADPAFARFGQLIADYAPSGRGDHRYWLQSAPCTMDIGEVERIWAAIDQHDDWTAFSAKIDEIRTMGEALAQQRD